MYNKSNKRYPKCATTSKHDKANFLMDFHFDKIINRTKRQCEGGISKPRKHLTKAANAVDRLLGVQTQ